jgi:large subunit ribosomal protein L18
MSLLSKHAQRTKRRKLRSRNHVKSTASLPRVSVHRSLNQIYAQIIDDAAGKTLASASSLKLTKTSGKKDIAKAVGIELAEKAKRAGIEAACFDRGQFLYHGRIQAVADGLREGGLKI